MRYKSIYVTSFITVKNPNPEPDEDDMMEVEVEALCSYLPGHNGNFWHPPEGPEVVVEEVTLDGQKINLDDLSEPEIVRIEEAAVQAAEDGYFD